MCNMIISTLSILFSALLVFAARIVDIKSGNMPDENGETKHSDNIKGCISSMLSVVLLVTNWRLVLMGSELLDHSDSNIIWVIAMAFALAFIVLMAIIYLALSLVEKYADKYIAEQEAEKKRKKIRQEILDRTLGKKVV